jgi:trehalose utilization protein
MPLPENKAELEKVYKYAESLDKPKKAETTLFSWFKKLNIFKVKTS